MQDMKVQLIQLSKCLRQLLRHQGSSESIGTRSVSATELNAIVPTSRAQRSFTPTETVKLLVEDQWIDNQHPVSNMIGEGTNPVSSRLAVQNRQVEARIEHHRRNPLLHLICQRSNDLINRLRRFSTLGLNSLRSNSMHASSFAGNIDARIDQPVLAVNKMFAIDKTESCGNDAVRFNIDTGCFDVKRRKAPAVPIHIVKLSMRSDASRKTSIHTSELDAYPKASYRAPSTTLAWSSARRALTSRGSWAIAGFQP
jgi:hypothetical protein